MPHHARVLFVTAALIAFSPLTLALVGMLAGYYATYRVDPLPVSWLTPHTTYRAAYLSQGDT